MKQNEIIKSLREQAGLTLEELAAKTNLSRSMLGHLEKGDRTGTIETLQKLSEFYGVSIDYITNNAERSALIDEFIKGLVKDGIIQDADHIPPEIEKQIINLIKLKIKKLM
jgi:transcriptional regulator with XRE-family HTH domain